jgi:hypothetical protein
MFPPRHQEFADYARMTRHPGPNRRRLFGKPELENWVAGPSPQAALG